MSTLPCIPYIELHVQDAKTEQEFLRLAVQAAVMKYRQAHANSINPNPLRATYDDACSLQETKTVSDTSPWHRLAEKSSASETDVP
jgi:hypothetical protein